MSPSILEYYLIEVEMHWQDFEWTIEIKYLYGISNFARVLRKNYSFSFLLPRLAG
jgi:hypothetical protein